MMSRQPRIPGRYLPLIVIAVAALMGVLLFRDDLSLAALARHRDALLAFRDAHDGIAVLVFVLAYVLIVALSLPGATVATLAGGFLFGLFPGVFYNVIAATIGAALLFLAVRAGFGAALARRIEARGGAAARLQTGLRQNEFSVLMVMRLVPALPFFLANLIPAVVGVRFDRFVLTTFLGIFPAGLVFTSIGAGLGEVFAAGGSPDLSVIFTPPILLPLLGLAALAALPMVVRHFRKPEV
jgi:uncharacterized membrane protein YdjX (TVP38/TMEM64 family)